MGIQALELMHHYTAIAHRTLAVHDQIANVLLHDVPQEALSCPFLLTQLLSFAGFHKAYLQPARRQSYFLSASFHQAQALNDMRQTLIEPITPSNCHALYASAIFLAVSTLAKLPSYEIYSHGFDPLNRLLEVFVLVDGMGIILNSSNHHLRAGPLRGLFAKPWTKTTLSNHLSIISRQLPALRSKVSQDLKNWDEDTLIAIEAIDTLIDSVDTVQEAHTLTASAELRAVFLWPIMVSNQYLILAQKRHPLSLVVLAYYCVLLRLAEEYYWFLKGWAGTVMTQLFQELHGTPWTDLLSWPLQVILYHR
ncbi:hypothetical protein PFICI_12707 [Pestalotiopsis fici W106-1]|uniref:Transcription factor domain-containing protein n=1 Tax=Pestalotiopsis fici (strain W106-1 / CGMCC3.15140) TaxID=1229662 RepID=W3WPI5_PESFW|nr:uncharacterized protein PFICI_12707 [Pestalotiopsis fici W106-1]ETS75763.1 hypothetical protein PFICI_12707 [Pestalotiopsis fici W106-1]